MVYTWLFLILVIIPHSHCKGGAKGGGGSKKSDDDGGDGDPHCGDSRNQITEAERQKNIRRNILSFMTIKPGSLFKAKTTDPGTRRYSLDDVDEEEFDFCMVCDGVALNESVDCKTVCYQTSDCYSLIYNTTQGVKIDKGCLYAPYDGREGCNKLSSWCSSSKNNTNCYCQHCEKEYCNWDSSSLGIRMNSLLVLVVGVIHFFVFLF